MTTKPCIVCGKSFPYTNPLQAICGPRCRHQRNVEHQRRYYGYQTGVIPCRICEKPFESERNRKVCSDECRVQSRRNAQKRQRANEKRRQAVWS